VPLTAEQSELYFSSFSPRFYLGRAQFAFPTTTEASRSFCRQYCSELSPRPLKYLSCVASWCVNGHAPVTRKLTTRCRPTSLVGTLRRSLSRPWPHIHGLRSVPQHGGELLSCRRVLLPSLPYNSDGLTRTQFRRKANAADNKAATVAVDSLLNYEAVKVRMRRHVGGELETDIDFMQRISATSNTRLNSMIRIYAHTKRLPSKLPHRLPFSTLARMSYSRRR
jgi:hypothetical protein